MGDEVLTTYIETDPNDRYEVTPNKIAISGVQRDEKAYVYDDKDVDFFDGDHVHYAKVQIDSGGTPSTVRTFYFFGLANVVKDHRAIIVDGDDQELMYANITSANNAHFGIREVDGGSFYDDGTSISTIAFDTPYYIDFRRVESAGTHGTIYSEIYGDPDQTIEEEALSVVLRTSKVKYRYNYAVQSLDVSQTNAMSGSFENYNLGLINLNAIEKEIGRGVCRGNGRGF